MAKLKIIIIKNLAISSASLTAAIRFNAPFLFKNAPRFPCNISGKAKANRC